MSERLNLAQPELPEAARLRRVRLTRDLLALAWALARFIAVLTSGVVIYGAALLVYVCVTGPFGGWVPTPKQETGEAYGR